MDLEYARDKYKQIEDILNDKDKLDDKHTKYINKKLKQLGEANLIDNIKNISKSEYSKFLMKEMFKDSLGQSNPQMIIQSYDPKNENINDLEYENTNHMVYDFEFKSIYELYKIFEEESKKYKENIISKENLAIEKIFNKDDFESYLDYLGEHTASDLYKKLNMKIYTIKNINLFFRILGYKECLDKVKTNTKNTRENTSKDITIKESRKYEINLKKLFNIYYIEDLDKVYKYEIYNNKSSYIRIRKCSDLLHPMLNKTLSLVLKNKMNRFNSSIIIDEENRFKHMLKGSIENEAVNLNSKVLIYTKKSDYKRSLYQLKIHM